MRQLAFIWDLDGTLVDSYPAIVPAVQDFCAGLGLRFSAEKIREAVLRSSVRDFLSELAVKLDRDPAEVYRSFSALNDSRIDAIRAMPHARACLEELKRKGHRNYVYTHRGASCRGILERTGLLSFFDLILTAQSGFPRKPDPSAIFYIIQKDSLEPNRCFYVGDRSLDVMAAENAGIRSILLHVPEHPLKPDPRASFRIQDLAELPALADRLQSEA